MNQKCWLRFAVYWRRSFRTGYLPAAQTLQMSLKQRTADKSAWRVAECKAIKAETHKLDEWAPLTCDLICRFSEICSNSRKNNILSAHLTSHFVWSFIPIIFMFSRCIPLVWRPFIETMVPTPVKRTLHTIIVYSPITELLLHQTTLWLDLPVTWKMYYSSKFPLYDDPWRRPQLRCKVHLYIHRPQF